MFKNPQDNIASKIVHWTFNHGDELFNTDFSIVILVEALKQALDISCSNFNSKVLDCLLELIAINFATLVDIALIEKCGQTNQTTVSSFDQLASEFVDKDSLELRNRLGAFDQDTSVCSGSII